MGTNENIGSSPNILSALNLTQNNVNSNKIAQKLLEFSMVLENVRLDGETEARILISSSKSVSSKIIKCIQNMQDEPNLENLTKEVEADMEELGTCESQLVRNKAELEELEKKNKENKAKQKLQQKELRETSEKLEKGQREWEELDKTTREKEENVKELRQKMNKWEVDKAELDARVAELKEFMSESVKKEFTLQKDIESLKLQIGEYEEQNRTKQNENLGLEAKKNGLDQKKAILVQQKERIQAQREQLNEQLRERETELEKLAKKHQEILEEIVGAELGIQKMETQKKTLSLQIEEERGKLSQREEETAEVETEQVRKRGELEGVMEAQASLLRKTEKWGRQKGKLGRLVKEMRGVVARSRKLAKKLHRLLPSNKKKTFQASQTMENFYQSQRNNRVDKSLTRKNSQASQSDQEDQKGSRRRVLQSQLEEHSEGESEDWDEVRKYYSTQPQPEMIPGEEHTKDNRQSMIAMSIQKFKRKHPGLGESKFYQNNFSGSGRSDQRRNSSARRT